MFFLLIIGKPKNKHITIIKKATSSSVYIDILFTAQKSVLINIEDYAKYEEFLHQRYVAEALAKAKQQAADPDTQWADHESVWETLGKHYDV